MRTTITLDDDIFLVAKNYAGEQSTSIGKIISNLVRKALSRPSKKNQRNGFPVFSVEDKSKLITLEDLKKYEDDI